MKRLLGFVVVALLSTFPMYAGGTKWVSAYYAGWLQGSQLSPDEIDYSAVTHIIHFALVVSDDGSVAGEANGITPTAAMAAVRAAHGANRKIIISVGGSSTDGVFAGATSPANRPKFIAALVKFMTDYGYDGIDVDWEPLQSTAHYVDFISELRREMTAARAGSVLITAVMMGTDGKLLAGAAQYFDQINIMTYDISGPWPNWVTWHNTALYDGGATFPSNGRVLPSADGAVKDKIAAGVPAAKLGIGIDFYGYRWWGGEGTSTGGVSKPRQGWKVYPSVKGNIPYYQLMDSYVRNRPSWDSAAQSAYISIDNPGASQDEFISYDNEQTIRSKAEYVQKMGIGGVIVFELGGGYRRSLPAGFRDLLLQNVRYSFLGGKKPLDDTVPPSVIIIAPRDGASIAGTTSFQAQATDNSAVAFVEFSVDGEPAGPVCSKPPMTLSVNSWKFKNGAHTVEAVAWDVFGNRAVTRHAFVVDNVGTMPLLPDKIVYNDALYPPFANTSWGAVVNFDSHDLVRSGRSSAEVDFLAWGALDLLSGTWGAESPLDPTEFDTLKADIYPALPLTLKIAFYNSVSSEVSLMANQWNSIAVPLAFTQPFTRFYFQSHLNKPVKCYFDNIRFTAKIYSATATR